MGRWIVWALVSALWTVSLLVPIILPDMGPVDELRELIQFYVAKTAHVLMYALWTIYTGWLRPSPRVRTGLLFVIMAHAVGSEWAQEFTGYRTGSLRDAALDQFGVLIGLVVARRWWFDDCATSSGE